MIPWQDVVFALGGVFFTVALVPILRNPAARLPRRTSVPTAIFLALFVFTHFSLGLYWATFTESCSCAAWSFIAWRRNLTR